MITAQEITAQLETIAAAEYFQEQTAELTDAWTVAGLAVESVEPVLRFIEEHPDLEYGTPGALVHFVEQFHRVGYEEQLLESIKRKPTSHTVWMLNRLVNGTTAPDMRRLLIAALDDAGRHPGADQDTQREVRHFLERLI